MTQANDLHNTLKKLHAASDQLLAVLELEAERLNARDVQALVDVLAEKQQRVAEVESLEQLRQQQCQTLGLDPQTLDSRFESSWQALLHVAGQCQSRNRDNHALLVANQRYVDEALRILSASDEESDAASYTATGDTKSIPGRSFGEA